MPTPDRLQTCLAPPPPAVEREWTKALCGSDSEVLARLNAAMKRIDLTCLIASPILVGLVMQVRMAGLGWSRGDAAVACGVALHGTDTTFRAPAPAVPSCDHATLFPLPLIHLPAARRRATHGSSHSGAAWMEPRELAARGDAAALRPAAQSGPGGRQAWQAAGSARQQRSSSSSKWGRSGKARWRAAAAAGGMGAVCPAASRGCSTGTGALILYCAELW